MSWEKKKKSFGGKKDAQLYIKHPDYLFPVESWEICKFGIIEETPYSS